MRIIDFHAHLSDHWFTMRGMDEASVLEAMGRVGVECGVFFTLMGFYEDCRPYNDHLAARARANPKRIIPFVTVDPKLGAPAVRELERCLADPIFRGVKFHTWLQAFAPSMVRETMVDILKLAAQRDLPVIFHDGTPPYATTFQIAALARWVPEATIVLGHAGLSDYVTAAGQLLRDTPNLHATLCCPKAGELLYLLDMAGSEKITWGSDFGFTDWRMLAERLDDVLEAGLDEETRDKVLYANAAKLLHLDSRPL